MIETQSCPRCGTQLNTGSPAGLCPKCLLKAGLGQPSGAPFSPTSSQPGLSFVPPTPEELAQLFPQFEVLELLGKGGMGAVYKVRQPHLDRLVALKILPPEVGQDPAFAERFAREARALAKLNHPNIVAVYDFGQCAGLYYFVMEYVDGANLRQMIQQGNLQSKEALAIVPQICEALQFAHDEGIVHRDIKPENILIDRRGRVKIADFGLAKLLGAGYVDGTLTGTHQVMGTVHYMAPEQLQGARTVDHRADIYSLGVVFYEMLTGRLPLGRFDPPSKKAHIDVRLDDVVLRTLEAEPERRYQHVSEVSTDLQHVANSPAVHTRQISPTVVTTSSPKLDVNVLAACVGALLGVIMPWGSLGGHPVPALTTQIEFGPTHLPNWLLAIAALSIGALVILEHRQLYSGRTIVMVLALYGCLHGVIAMAELGRHSGNIEIGPLVTIGSFFAVAVLRMQLFIRLAVGWGLAYLVASIMALLAGLATAPIASRFSYFGPLVAAPALVASLLFFLALVVIEPLRRYVGELPRSLASPNVRLSTVIRCALFLFGLLSVAAVMTFVAWDTVGNRVTQLGPNAIVVIVVTATIANLLIASITTRALGWYGIRRFADASTPDSIPYLSSERPEQYDFMSPADESLRNQLRVPTTLLITSAILDFITLVFLVILAIHEVREHGPISDPVSPIIVLVLAIRTSLCFIIGAGAIALRKLRNYRLGKAACYFAMAPISPGFFLGLPAGLWLVRILNREDVMDAFQRRAAKSGEQDRSQTLLLIPTIVMTALALLIVIWSYGSQSQSTASVHPPTRAVYVSPSIPATSYHLWAFVDGHFEIGPALADPLELKPEQVEALNRILKETYEQYLAIEKTHTHKSSDRPGRVIVTIDQFSSEMEALENDFWTKVDAIMRDDVQRRGARERIRPLLRESVFQFHGGMRVEIWRSGSFYAWKFEHSVMMPGSDYREPHFTTMSSQQEDARLPGLLERFWE